MEIRLRAPLRYYDRRAALIGYEALLFTVPARTTLTVLDLFDGFALCSTPKGQIIPVGRERIRESAYLPRAKHPT